MSGSIRRPRLGIVCSGKQATFIRRMGSAMLRRLLLSGCRVFHAGLALLRRRPEREVRACPGDDVIPSATERSPAFWR